MKSRIWRWAGVAVLGMGLATGCLAEGPGMGPGPAPGGPGPRPGPEDPNGPGHSPLNSRDEVRQTQPPRPGYYQDIPRRDGQYRHWQAGGPGQRYRPGHRIDGFPDRYWRVPYQGHEYVYSEGYWYRPQGNGYIVVVPPPGARIGTLPGYAQEVWIEGRRYFLVADTCYQYLEATGEYVVTPPCRP